MATAIIMAIAAYSVYISYGGNGAAGSGCAGVGASDTLMAVFVCEGQ